MGTILGSSLCGYISDRIGRRKLLMFLGALSSLVCMLTIMTLSSASFFILSLLFFCLGLTSSTQVLGYPLITENTPPHLTGTSMSIAAVIIMGLAGIAQVASGKLIDLTWNGLIVNGAPIYSRSDFMHCFAMFPLALASAALLLIGINESKKGSRLTPKKI